MAEARPGLVVLEPRPASLDRPAPSAACRYEGTLRAERSGGETGSLWLVDATVAAGGGLRWDGPHGDEALYVRSGQVVVAGGPLGAGSVVVVEAGAGAQVEVVDDARLVHLGPSDPSPPSGAQRTTPVAGEPGVHLIGPEGRWRRQEPEQDSRYFLDGHCPSCHLSLLRMARFGPYRSGSHAHSEDEIIYVLEGAIQVGATVVEAGSGVAIAAGHRYGFRGADEGFAFLNYRRDASSITRDPRDGPLVEGGAAHGMSPVGGDRKLTPPAPRGAGPS